MHWLIVDITNGEKIRDGIEKMKFAPSKMEKYFALISSIFKKNAN